MLSNQDLVSNDGQLERLDRLRFEGIGLHPGAEPVDALQGRLTADRDELDVGVHYFDRSVEVAAVERLITPAKTCADLCVSGRHRLRSIRYSCSPAASRASLNEG